MEHNIVGGKMESHLLDIARRGVLLDTIVLVNESQLTEHGTR